MESTGSTTFPGGVCSMHSPSCQYVETLIMTLFSFMQDLICLIGYIQTFVVEALRY